MGGVPKGILGPVHGGNGPVCVIVTAGVEPAVTTSFTVGITVAPTFVCGISPLFGGFAISLTLLLVLVLLVYILALLNNMQYSLKRRIFYIRRLNVKKSTQGPTRCANLFAVKNGKQTLIFQKITYLVTRRIDQIDPKTWLIFVV